MADNDWIVEAHTHGSAFLVTPGGQRVALMTAARARGIAAALNTTEGRVAYLAAHSGPSPVGRPGQYQGDQHWPDCDSRSAR